MSTTIDQRVVEMRFDNKNFESNVSTTMSSLDKLKRSLNLTGASKGLENINAAAKNNNIHMLGSAAETVGLKFNAMYSMADQYFRNLENRIEHTARRMVSALTIDPIKTGFQEYETQINAVQTILANTSHNGTTIDQVNDALDKLNIYADKTIYNFTEMTRNIGTFTAAGVDLQTSVDSIQGIANLAAVSGSTSQQASTAMYQLSQALAAGKVSLMDWNSVVNAGMGGKVFQDALVRTSELLKTGGKAAIDTYGSFRESLTKGEWLTTEVLTETLKQFSGAYSEADLIAQGFTKEQAKDIAAMAKTAEDAATKVKTFTQLWDVLKESAQSGWSQTWKLLIGDFEQAKELLTPLADFLTGAINSFSEARNRVLESALGKTFTGLADNIKNVMNSVTKSADGIKTVVDSVSDYATVVDEIIGGKWGVGQQRWDKLAEAGYDWAHAQNLVNEKLGNAKRHATDYKEAQDGVNDAQKKGAEAQNEMSESTIDLIANLVEMSDADLKLKGYTDEQIKAFRELGEAADKTGIPIKDLLSNIDNINGRWLLIESLKNAGSGLVGVFKAIGEAWNDAFGIAEEEKANNLFNFIAGLHKFSVGLRLTDKETGELNETGKKLARTFKGIFAVVDILTTILTGGFKIAFKILSSVLGYFNLDILDVTANIGDALVAFRDWFDSIFDISGVLQIIVPIIGDLVGKFKTWFNVMGQSTEFGKFAEALGAVVEHVKSFIRGFKNLNSIKEIPKYIVEGLIKGLGTEAKNIWNAFVEFAKAAIQSFRETMGIHSPSTVFFEFGQNIVQGLVNGISAAISWAIDGIKNLGSVIAKFFEGIDFGGVTNSVGPELDKIKEMFANFDYQKLLAIIPIAAVAFMIKKIYDIASALADGINNFNDVLEGFANIENQFAKLIKSFSLNVKAKAFKNIAISIAILVGSLIALTFVDTDKLYDAVGIIVVLAGVLALLMFAMNKMSDASVKLDKNGLNVDGIKNSLISMGIAMLLVAATVKMIGSLKPEEAIQGFLGLAGILAALVIAMTAFGLMSKFDMTKDIDKFGGLIIKLGIALALMTWVCKLAAKLTIGEIIEGAAFMAVFVGFVKLLTLATTIDKGDETAKLSGMLIKISIAMMLMVLVCKLAAKLTIGEIIEGAAFMAVFVGFVKLLVKVTTIGKEQQIAKLGGLLLSISISLLLMIGVCELVGQLKIGEMIKGALFLLGFLGFIKLLTTVTTIADGKKTAKLAGTILAVSIAIGMLAGIAILLSMIPVKGLINGVLAVTIFGIMLTALIKATHGAEKVVGNLIVMTVAIVILIAGVAVLSTLDPNRLAGATAALTIVVGIFALLVKVAGTCKGAIAPLIVMTLAVGLLGGLIYLLAKLPIKSTIGAATSLSILLLAMASSMAIIGTFGSIATKGLIALGIMTLVVGILAGILWLIRDLPVETTIANVTALTTLLLSLSAACAILTAVGLGGPAALIGIGSLLALILSVGVLVTAIGALVSAFPKLEEFLDTGIPIMKKIGTAIGSFFGSIVGAFAESATSTLPTVGSNLSTFMDNLSGFISGARSIDDGALTGIKNLAAMMLLISGASIVNAVASWFTGGSSIESFSSSLDSFADAIVSFSTKVKGNIDESSVLAAANAGKLLAEMQSTIPGSGGVIQWFCGEKDFVSFGAGLIAFGNAITQFSRIVGAEGAINETAITAAANAGKMMAEMQSTIPNTGGLVGWFTGEKDFSSFGAGLVSFGTAIVSFSSVVSAGGGINETAITAAANAGKMMAEMQSTIPNTGGVVGWFCGEKDFASFGAGLISFGTAIVSFSSVVSAGGGINETAITAAANAGKMMAEMQSTIPNTGGVVGWFTGEKDFTSFGNGLISFGTAIVAFSRIVGAEGAINETAITAAANAGKMMVEMQSMMAPADGVFQWFTGEKDFATFGNDLVAFGNALVNFSKTVSADGAISTESITMAANAGKMMAGVQEAIPTDKWLDGKISIDDFGKKIVAFGTGIANYSKTVAEIDAGAVSSSIASATRLVDLAKSVVDLNVDGISLFSKVTGIGTTIKTYYDKISEVDMSVISSSVSTTKKLVNLINSLVDIDTSGISLFKNAVSSLSTVSFDGIEKAFGGAGSKLSSIGSTMMDSLVSGMKTKQTSLNGAASVLSTGLYKVWTSKGELFKNAGATLMTNFISGIKSKETEVRNAAVKPAESAVTSIRNKYSSFKSAGSYLVDGFASGIKESTYKATAQAIAMANAAEKAAKEALKINSPSKIFRAIGYSVPEGFAMGIERMSRLVTSASTYMTDVALKDVKDSVSNIANLISADMDTQPTIRPVLDLSDVKSGVGTLSSIFNGSPAIGVSAKINSISARMNNQNGANNSDIVSAIKDLKSEIGKIQGTTNIIEGVTYGDDSSISNAVQSLVRAATIERRI